MKNFIGRERELAALEEAYARPRSELVPIFGRRRVGKSELIIRFLRDKPAVYFVGKKAVAGLQISEFLREASVALSEPLLSTLPAEDWKTALDATVERWNRPDKLVIALDEFQWTAASSPELPSVIQEFWDRKWKKRKNVLLILCGSLIGFMEREVLGKTSPLFGRRTARILLKPFSYQEAALFHPSYSTLDRAKTYFICGGVPLYLEYFSPENSVRTNIEKNLLNEFAPLHREPDFLLREELREVEKYSAILFAVSTGSLPAARISTLTGIGDRSLYYYLQQLVQLGYLSRRYPLTGSTPAARHVRYKLNDPLLRFWFRFVFPNTSFIQQRGGKEAMKVRIQPQLDGFFAAGFEQLCREALPVLYERESVAASYDIGEYWDKETHIDVVGFRDDGWTDLGECKWGQVASTPALVKELEAKVEKYPNPRNATIGRRIFTRDPVGRKQKEGRGVRWHTLADLY